MSPSDDYLDTWNNAICNVWEYIIMLLNKLIPLKYCVTMKLKTEMQYVLDLDEGNQSLEKLNWLIHTGKLNTL